MKSLVEVLKNPHFILCKNGNRLYIGDSFICRGQESWGKFTIVHIDETELPEKQIHASRPKNSFHNSINDWNKI